MFLGQCRNFLNVSVLFSGKLEHFMVRMFVLGLCCKKILFGMLFVWCPVMDWCTTLPHVKSSDRLQIQRLLVTIDQ